MAVILGTDSYVQYWIPIVLGSILVFMFIRPASQNPYKDFSETPDPEGFTTCWCWRFCRIAFPR